MSIKIILLGYSYVMRKANIKDFEPQIIYDAYEKYKTITLVAKNLNLDRGVITRFFIKNNFKYKKQLTYNVDHTFFDTLTPKSMYWAGFLAADGNIGKNNCRISLCIAIKDIKHIKKFKKDLKCEAPISIRFMKSILPSGKNHNGYYCQIRFTSKKIYEALQKTFNFTHNKSLTLQFPEHLKDHQYINHFIRGLIDGDGSVYKIKKKRSGKIFLCGSKSIVESTYNILKNIGKVPEESKALKLKDNEISHFNITNLDQIKPIINYLQYNSNNVSLNRKRKTALKLLKYKSFSELLHDKIIILDELKIKNLLSLSKNRQEIANYFNCSISTVDRQMKKYGLSGTIKKQAPLKPKVVKIKHKSKTDIVIEKVKDLPYTEFKNLNKFERQIWAKNNEYLIYSLYKEAGSADKLRKIVDIERSLIFKIVNKIEKV